MDSTLFLYQSIVDDSKVLSDNEKAIVMNIVKAKFPYTSAEDVATMVRGAEKAIKDGEKLSRMSQMVYKGDKV